MSLFKKAIAGVLASAMMLSFTSCADTTWVYKTEKSSVSSGVYLAMLTFSYLNATSSLSASSSDVDATVWEQKIGDVAAEDYIKNDSLATAKDYLVVEDKFQEFNLSLSEEETTSVNNDVDSMWTYMGNFVDMEESGISKESFAKYYLNSAKKSKIFDYYYAEGGIEEVKDKELKKFYNKNFIAAKLIAIPTVNDEGASLEDSEIKKLKKQAKKYQSRLDNGENMDKIINEYNKSNATSSDEYTETKGEENIQIFYKDDTNTEAIYKKAKKAKIGNSFYLEDSGYIYVGVKEDITKYEDTYQSSRATALSYYKNADFTALVEDWISKVALTTNNSSVKRYSPKNLVVLG